MKRIIFLIFIPILCFGQKYKVSDSKTSFFSNAPLENITASSSDLQGIIDLETGEFFFRLPIKSFNFKIISFNIKHGKKTYFFIF